MALGARTSIKTAQAWWAIAPPNFFVILILALAHWALLNLFTKQLFLPFFSWNFSLQWRIFEFKYYLILFVHIQGDIKFKEFFQFSSWLAPDSKSLIKLTLKYKSQKMTLVSVFALDRHKIKGPNHYDSLSMANKKP